MKRIIAFLAILAMAFNAKAGSVTINNTTSSTFTGVFTTVGTIGVGGGTWSGSTIVSIPPGPPLVFPTINDFYAFTTSGMSSFPATALVYGWWFAPAGSGPCGFNGQGGLTQTFPCPGVSGGSVTVTTVVTTTSTIITIS